MESKTPQLDLYKEDLRKALLKRASDFGVQNLPEETINKAVDNMVAMFKAEILKQMKIRQIRAKDVYNREFVIMPCNHMIYSQNINEIVETKLANKHIALEEILMKTNLRFSVIYGDKKTKFLEGDPKIVDIPGDIFKFLIEREYYIDLLDYLINHNFYIHYDLIEIFKKILKVSKNFQAKSQLLDKDDTNVIEYIIHKYNSHSFSNLESKYTEHIGYFKYKSLVEKCTDLKISIKELVNRVYVHNMDIEEAIKIGEKERDLYGLDNISGGDLQVSSAVKEVFYAVTREYMKEEENNNE